MTSSQPAIFTGRNENDFFRRPYNTTIAFAVGLLLFLLPFAELRCGNMALIGNSGIGIAIGTEWKVAGSAAGLKEKLGSELDMKSKSSPLKDKPNVLLLVAIAAAFFGIGISFSPQRWKYVGGMCAGILAALMLVAAMVQLKLLFKNGMNKIPSKDDMDMKMGRLIQLKFTIWYYLSLAAFVTAAFFNYKRNKIEEQDEIDKHTRFEFQQQEPLPPEDTFKHSSL